ncbi:hypothetical protein MCAP1_003316 [Malassezia caprae]|uniref:ER membrane protein complex subunit 3 n=1 Tax=Malassezia caprae TaxID=1381934 RepID=A0AAF0E8S1_9BASI|nr:hypothetical protein MCAP1_003316 [Malassezia caprae]
MEQSLLLDSALRDWVLLPITLVMVLVGVFRNNIMKLLEGKPKMTTLTAARQQHILSRSATLRMNYPAIPPAAVEGRKSFLSRVLGDGTYLAPETKQAAEKEANRQPDEMPESPFNEASMEGMMDMAKRSLVMMIPQTIIMGWINFFFTGFVITRLPFPLTQRFKIMLQRDVDTADLNVSWVSSLSWYFLNLYGLDAIYRLVLGSSQAAHSMRDMAAFGGGAALMNQSQNPMAPQTDYIKLHHAERDSLELIGAIGTKDARWVGDGVEARVLGLYQR